MRDEIMEAVVLFVAIVLGLVFLTSIAKALAFALAWVFVAVQP